MSYHEDHQHSAAPPDHASGHRDPNTSASPAPPAPSSGTPKKPASTRWKLVIQLLGASSIFVAAITALAYLHGRSFHDGWYSHFHLDPGMFPLDNAGMLTMGFEAWVDGISLRPSAMTSRFEVLHLRASADSGQAKHRFRRSLNILLVLTMADSLLLRPYSNGALLADHNPRRLDGAGASCDRQMSTHFYRSRTAAFGKAHL